MDDYQYLESIGSGVKIKSPDGTQKNVHLDEAFHDLNNDLTKGLDKIFGANEVDAYEASCNTCKHFQRQPMSPHQKMERNVFGMPGQCGKKHIPVVGWQRGQFCGFENSGCYENRRTGVRQQEAFKPREATHD